MGLMLRFAKPLALLGIGCFFGVTITAGVPNIDHVQSAQNSQRPNLSAPSLSELSNMISPEIMEAAISTFYSVTDSIDGLIDGAQQHWESETESKLLYARAASSSDYRAVNKNTRRR
jgi:hypothetical protein